MNLTGVIQSGTTKVSDDIKIHYTIPASGSGIADSISAVIYKNNSIVGYFNASRNGTIGLSLTEKNGISTGESKKIFCNLMEDMESIFGSSEE